ncbi:MAG TPA: hypothetical protein VM101_06180 [Flavitalea sp.]|nr:hypothetical protein [Flavitalea sp.]
MRTKTFISTFMLLFVLAIANAQHGNKTAASKLDGAWQSQDNKGFTVIHGGYFNSVGVDSSGKWGDMHAGSFTVNNDNTVTFKVLYSSYPEHIGSLNTAEYTITGETIKLHQFKKLVDGNGKDITDQVPKDVIETMTRLK